MLAAPVGAPEMARARAAAVTVGVERVLVAAAMVAAAKARRTGQAKDRHPKASIVDRYQLSLATASEC